MKCYGNAHTKLQWIGSSYREDGDGLVILNASRHLMLPDRWNPQGKRRRGRPRNTWQRDLVADGKKAGYAWGELEQMAQDVGGNSLMAYAPGGVTGLSEVKTKQLHI